MPKLIWTMAGAGRSAARMAVKGVLKMTCRLLILLALCMAASAATGAPAYDSRTPLYDIGAAGQAIDKLPEMLKAAYDKGRPVVLYVHGRGAEPQKSFDAGMTGGGAVPRLEKEYGVSVIMLNWKSKGKGDDRSDPLDNVPDAAGNLVRVLALLRQFRAANPQLPPPALLVHSMGSIVLAKTVADADWPAPAGQPLFAGVLLSEPDADSQGHAVWLAKVAAVERVFVTQNRVDSVLKRSTDARNPASNFALGLDPVAPLAVQANYVNLTDALGAKGPFNIVRAHQIFSKGWMGGNVNTCLFVTTVLRGGAPDFASLPAVRAPSAGRYVFDKKINKKDKCFSATEAGASDDE